VTAELSNRERDVLVGVSEGLTNVRIGRKLSITPATVSMHLTRLFRKIGAHDRAHAVAISFRAGVLVAEPSVELWRMEARLEEFERDNVRLRQVIELCGCPHRGTRGLSGVA